MAAPKLLSLFALASLLIVALSFGPLHVNALVADRAHVARHVHARNAVAKRKRSDSSTSNRCQPRPTSSIGSSLPSLPTSTSTPPPPPPTSTTPPAPSTTFAAASPTLNGKKRCLAYGADPALLPNFARPKVGYLYNWAPTFSGGLNPDGLGFAPMLWGADTQRLDDFMTLVVNGPDNPGGLALGFNEPNEPTQANITPQDALTHWISHIMPLKAKGYSLVSPACTDDDAGATWYNEFFNLCWANTSCQVDFAAMHSYTTDPNHLITYATELHNNYSLPVMITEFADQDYSGGNNQSTMDEVWAFADAVTKFADSTDWIEFICPFGIMSPLPNGVNPDNALLNTTTGGPTDLGYTYFG